MATKQTLNAIDQIKRNLQPKIYQKLKKSLKGVVEGELKKELTP